MLKAFLSRIEHLFCRSVRVDATVTVRGRRSLRTYAFPVEHGVVVARARAFLKESGQRDERDVVVFLIRTLDRRTELGGLFSALRLVVVRIRGIEVVERGVHHVALVGERLRHILDLTLYRGRAPTRCGCALDGVGAGTEHADALRSCDGKRIVVVLEKYRSFLGHLDVQSFRGGLRLFHGSIIGIKITVLFHGAESSGMVIAGNKNAEHDGQYYCEDYRQKCEAFRHFPFFHLEKTS